MNIRLADYVFNRLFELTGSRHCFFLSGGGIMHLCDALGRCTSIAPVAMHHEQAAAIAADAYGRVNNTVGIVLVTTGPGSTNAITGVSGAYLESTPLLVISGQVSRATFKGASLVRQLGFQEIDIVPIVKSFTKYAETVIDPSTIKYHLEKAIYLAKEGRPGPVWLDIPVDVQGALVNPDELQGFDPAVEGFEAQAKAPTPAELEQVLQLLNQAKRPLVIGGHGIWLSGAKESFRKLLTQLQIPVQTTWNGIDLLEEDFPLFFGRANSYGPRYPNIILQNCDLILAIGARLGIQHIGYNYAAFAPQAKLIMVDVDQEELTKKTLNVSLPIHADARMFIGLLSSVFKSTGNHERWIAWCQKIKQAYPTITEYNEDPCFVDAYKFADELSDAMQPGDLIVPGSSGTGFTVTTQMFRIKAGQRYITSKGHAAMGYGLPSSIGACIAGQLKRTVTIVGDGGLQLNIQELQTIIHNKLPVVLFIFNNKGYFSIRVTQHNYFSGKLVGSDTDSGTSMPDLQRIAEAYGFRYLRISNNAELREGINSALHEPWPVLVEVLINPDKSLFPKLSSRRLEDGQMASSTLDDMEPFLPREELAQIRREALEI